MHFRSSGGARLRNVTGQGGATGHAAGARLRNVHVHGDASEHALELGDVHDHGGASEHALAAGDLRLHRCGGWLRSQKYPTTYQCGHHFVACIVRLARASSLIISQSYMQIPFGVLYASAISILNHIKLLGDIEADVWKKAA